MVTIGVDAHKRVHAAVMIDAAGRELGQWRGRNTPTGWQELQGWAHPTPAAEVIWGIEGAGQYGHGLAQHLVRAGDVVVEVNPRLTATMRRGSRPRGKTDRLDALAVARVVQQEQAALPVVLPDDATTVLATLETARAAALAEATRVRNQLHQHLTQLEAVDAGPWPDLTVPAQVARLTTYQAPVADSVLGAHATVVRLLAARLHLALTQVAELGQALVSQAQAWTAPLTAIVGVADLTAALLAAHLGGHCFRTDAALASHAGIAPLAASSGAHQRHRLNRGGNRQLNAIIHRIALTQGRCYPPAQAYLARKRADGKTRDEAVRCLKRYIVRAVFRAWQHCQVPPASPPLT